VSASAQPANALLERLVSAEPIAKGDSFWHELFSSSLPVSQERAAAEEVSAVSFAYCSELSRNNAESSNFQTLVVEMVEKLERARTKASEGLLLQCCGSVFLMRTFLKHMLETFEPEDVLPHLSLPEKNEAHLAEALVDSLLTTLADCALDDASYWLHMELLAATTVCLSSQLFCELSSAAPLPLVVAALGCSGPLTERLVLRLLQHYVGRPPPPQSSEGLLRTISSGLGYVIHLPWQLFSYLFREPGASPLQLADRALQVLLLLTQHLPPALFPNPASSNFYLLALRSIGDSSVEVDVGSEGGDPEAGAVRTSTVAFRRLHDVIAEALPQEGAAVLLYLMLHGNRDFLDHTLSRADPDTLLMPLLRTLYGVQTLRHNQLYMLLIVLLMLTQDEGFISTAHSVVLPSVPWYKERILQKISLGSLIVVLIFRTVQYNTASMQDAYVHTNCLAALANMAPTFKKMHPHAARCLVSLYEVLSRKYIKLRDTRAAITPQPEDDVGEDEDGDAELLRLEDELGAYTDFVRMGLEVLNVALATTPAQNEHLIYALLERQRVFDSLKSHERFWDLIENISHVIVHFGGALQPTTHGETAEAVWSVDKVIAAIRSASRTWSSSQMSNVPDPRFTYEQEASPEEFFTPYVWLIVYEQAGISWQPNRIVVLPSNSAGGGASSEVDPNLPPLMSIDVADD